MRKIHSLRTKLLVVTLSIMVLVISISLVVFLVFINRTLGSFVRDNLDFTMGTIENAFSDKFLLIERRTLALRNDSEFLSYLDDPMSETGQRRFFEDVDIYSDSNLINERLPFIESVYLYNHDMGFFSALYYDLPEREKLLVDRRMTGYAADFLEADADHLYYQDADYLYYLTACYNEEMDSVGTIIYAMNKSALMQMLSTVTGYDGAFYALTLPSGKQVFSYGLPADFVLPSPCSGPFDKSLGDMEYRMYTGNVGFRPNLTIGVPADILSTLLFSTTRIYLVILVILLISFSILLFLFIARLTRPLPEVAMQLEKVANKDFSAKLPPYQSREFNVISHTFNDMTETINHLIRDVYEKELLATKNELQFLQSQMNPHFMYNVLNSLAIKARFDGNEELSSMITAFTSLIQARLQQQGNTKITIADELSLVRFYLELQHYRFQDKLSYSIEYSDDSLLTALVPRLSIEFAVENAVVHGIEPKPGPGYVSVKVCRQGDDVSIVIEDDGVGFKGYDGHVQLPYENASRPFDAKHNHVAMNNILKLVSYYYEPPYGMMIHSSEGKGTTVSILLPFERRD